MKTLSPVKGRAPAAIRKSGVLGPDGKEVSYFLYPSPRFNHRQYKPRQWLSNDNKVNVSEYDRMELVNYSRQLRAQIDILDSAITQKNSWAFGDAWDAHYSGAHKEWGQAAEDWLNNVWMPNCCVRGPQYGFKRCMRLMGMAWDVDGDDAMLLTESKNGFPMLAFYPAPKIANWGQGFGTQSQPRNIRNSLGAGSTLFGTTVDGGPYDGARIHDGIIYDRNSRPIALRIVGDDGTFQDISTFSIDLAYEPTWADQARGIPKIAVGLLKWMNRQDIDEFMQRGIKRAASVGLVMKNEEGEAAIGNEIITEEDTTQLPPGETTDRQVAYEEIEGGEMYVLSSLANETIEGLNYKNPHPNTEAYIERLTSEALASVGWFWELTNLSETGRAPTRLLCDLANQIIWDRQETGYRRWKRAIGWAVAKGMKIGAIPKNNDGFDPYMWCPGLPKMMSVDAGNDFQADREGLKMGLTNKMVVAQKNLGMHYRDLDRQRAIELKETIEQAIAISKEFPQLDFDRALELLEQRSPNPIQIRAQKGPDAGPKKTTTASVVGSDEPTKVRVSHDLDLTLKAQRSQRRVVFDRDDNGNLLTARLEEA